ncbi:MAG: hypothetical protein F6K19_00620 [Cyanothece sp. SIO1E1]|nr:hypothetical protein [Cyanothece sp. SIO1E1]
MDGLSLSPEICEVSNFLALPTLPPPLELIKLNFQDLKVLEPVCEQYDQWGVRFKDAIALQPSNPAFRANMEPLVIMPSTPQSSLKAYFEQTQGKVGALVQGARRITLTAFDREGKQLDQASTSTPQYITPRLKQGKELPKTRLYLEDWHIAKVIFQSDAPFTIENFCFGL